MSGAEIGTVIGAAMGVALLSLLWSLLFKRLMTGYLQIAVSVVAAYITAVILNGYGSADGGKPNFVAGVIPYGIGALIVFGLRAFGSVRKSGEQNG